MPSSAELYAEHYNVPDRPLFGRFDFDTEDQKKSRQKTATELAQRGLAFG